MEMTGCTCMMVLNQLKTDLNKSMYGFIKTMQLHLLSQKIQEMILVSWKIGRIKTTCKCVV